MTICTPLSQLLPVKNVSGVFKAVSLSKKKYIINVVGGGETKDLVRMAKDLNIEEKVRFWGSLPNDRARRVLKNSDAFVLNSFHEGMPHALIEALAEGVPVVATKIPAVMEILEDRKTGILVNVDDPKDLAKKLEMLPKYKDALVKSGRELYKEKFTWDKHLTQLYNVFNGLVNHPGTA